MVRIHCICTYSLQIGTYLAIYGKICTYSLQIGTYLAILYVHMYIFIVNMYILILLLMACHTSAIAIIISISTG